ncbi:SIMPL domain-containing protein [Franzmannia qiaohouensis]|uniref:SIMPL domain-containing protein n=1 Tax=Franzmannia qiaohouensis TaxID=1329370 RepID=A0ABU1HGB8_9GAMM|nr:SIMPL domain-containing protein [Halomonas qiaohouensis]MDR5905640.1 SIMPL domain-containing protein [Halomonas qiaohouensis]
MILSRSMRRPFALPLALLLATSLAAPLAMADMPRPQESRLSVQAQSSVEVTPDKASLSARLWERTPAVAAGDDQQTDPDALREARERLEERTGELIRTLEEAGLERDAISAGSLNVRPDHVNAPRQQDGERETLVRTQLERPITLTIDDLEQLPVILDALTEAGVNALDGVQYDLHDRDAATDRALTQALEKARHKAQLMADTLEVSLGSVTSVSEVQSPVFMPRMMAMRADTMESQGAGAEYRPGTIAIDAEVSVSWEIQD